MMIKGIDVSYANLSIDWSEVKKSGIEFAYKLVWFVNRKWKK